jgi:hypothetical protein
MPVAGAARDLDDGVADAHHDQTLVVCTMKARPSTGSDDCLGQPGDSLGTVQN